MNADEYGEFVFDALQRYGMTRDQGYSHKDYSKLIDVKPFFIS